MLVSCDSMIVWCHVSALLRLLRQTVEYLVYEHILMFAGFGLYDMALAWTRTSYITNGKMDLLLFVLRRMILFLLWSMTYKLQYTVTCPMLGYFAGFADILRSGGVGSTVDVGCARCR